MSDSNNTHHNTRDNALGLWKQQIKRDKAVDVSLGLNLTLPKNFINGQILCY